MDKQIFRYEAMNALSEKMAKASENMDWDLLVSLEKEQSELRDELINEIESFEFIGEAGKETTNRKKFLIEAILSNNKIVRSYTVPWMESVKVFLSNNDKPIPAKNASIIKAYDLGS